MSFSLSEVLFGSYFVYPTKGRSDVSRKAKDLAIAIKNDKQIRVGSEVVSAVAYCTKRLRERIEQTGLGCLFGRDVSLVPIPMSAPRVRGGQWHSLRICECLLAESLGGSILPCLERTQAIPSSTYHPGKRPETSEHFRTIRANKDVLSAADPPRRITLVDNQVTKGATAFACALRLHDAFPQTEIQLFAFVRTLGFVEDVANPAEPCLGRIAYNAEADSVDRNP